MPSPLSRSGWIEVSDSKSASDPPVRRYAHQEGFHLSLYDSVPDERTHPSARVRFDMRNVLCLRPAAGSAVEVFLPTGRKPYKLFASFGAADDEGAAAWLRLWCSSVDFGNVDRRLRLHRDYSLVLALDNTCWSQEAVPTSWRGASWRHLSLLHPAPPLLSPRSPHHPTYTPTTPRPSPLRFPAVCSEDSDSFPRAFLSSAEELPSALQLDAHEEAEEDAAAAAAGRRRASPSLSSASSASPPLSLPSPPLPSAFLPPPAHSSALLPSPLLAPPSTPAPPLPPPSLLPPPSAAAATPRFQFELPRHVDSSEAVVVNLPSGGKARVMLPAAAEAGQLVTFTLAPQAPAAMAACVAGDEGGPQRFEVRVPSGVPPSSELRVMTPLGVGLRLLLPAAAAPGHVLSFTATMPPPHLRVPAVLATPSARPAYFEAAVPLNLLPGEVFKAILPSAEAVLVTVPPAASKGTVLSFRAADRTGLGVSVAAREQQTGGEGELGAEDGKGESSQSSKSSHGSLSREHGGMVQLTVDTISKC
ncbi:hypothetical protein AB1Y20_020705 [Prymnesium parvum]|uniref:Uncharacterized protein n=1 Tax=Prymnesium parvum TaxID=97485 RepID=A0AB34JYC9_PRYPA